MPDPPDPTKNAFEFPTGIAATITLLTTVLGAAGIAGAVLLRAVRNNPSVIAVILFAILGVALFYFVLPSVAPPGPENGPVSKAWKWVFDRPSRIAVGLVLVTALSAAALVVGVASLGVRDQASLGLSANYVTSGTTVKVKATGGGLRSDETMLVQLIGFTGRWPTNQAESKLLADNGCTRSLLYITPDSKTPKTPAGVVLLWNQVGPTADGTATVDVSVDVPTGTYTGFCAMAAYSDRDDKTEDPALAFAHAPTK